VTLAAIVASSTGWYFFVANFYADLHMAIIPIERAIGRYLQARGRFFYYQRSICRHNRWCESSW